MVPIEEQVILDGVEWDEPVQVDPTTSVTVTAIGRETVEAQGPGEIGGPAVAVTIQIQNKDPRAELDLNHVTVTAVDKDKSPLIPLTAEPASPFVGSLVPGASGDGVYLFSLSSAETPLTITVNPAPAMPVAVFQGALSTK